MLHFCSKESHYNRTLFVVKAEHTWVVYKEVNKTIDDIVIRACKWIMEVILHDNMFSSLNIGFATWVASGKVGEESLSIFSNRGMVCGCTCEAGT